MRNGDGCHGCSGSVVKTSQWVGVYMELLCSVFNSLLNRSQGADSQRALWAYLFARVYSWILNLPGGLRKFLGWSELHLGSDTGRVCRVIGGGGGGSTEPKTTVRYRLHSYTPAVLFGLSFLSFVWSGGFGFEIECTLFNVLLSSDFLFQKVMLKEHMFKRYVTQMLAWSRPPFLGEFE